MLIFKTFCILIISSVGYKSIVQHSARALKQQHSSKEQFLVSAVVSVAAGMAEEEKGRAGEPMIMIVLGFSKEAKSTD